MEMADKIKAVYLALQPAETDPMLNFDERDLFSLAEAVGFTEINVELKLELKPMPEYLTWDALLNGAPNPKVPSLAEVIARILNDAEKEQFTTHLRSQFEDGKGKVRSALAYLCATKI
jgi:hypothetical protein